MSEDSIQRPAWQTEELQDEWVDLDTEDASDDDANNLTYGTRSISLTVPLPSHIHTNSDIEPDKSNSPAPFHAVGTFLVREDIPNGPMLPKTPGRGRTGIIKDFFSPLPLERMFEPPTPPIAPMPVPPAPPAAAPDSPSDEILETDMPNMVSFHGRKASIACQFTFAAPRNHALIPDAAKPSYPQAQSTPTPPFVPNNAAPTTDPRLRLFQFQYDTFTRDHLSALADSIAVNTPSGTGSRADGRLSTVSETSFSDLRSTKRVKLSPPSDYGEGAGARASIARPKIYGKAYVGESLSLMEKIKQARDFSTISTVASANNSSPDAGDNNDRNALTNDKSSAYEKLRRSSLLNVPTNTDSAPSSSGGTMNSSAPYSSSTYRQQAAALMAQIKSDMKGNKRIFSGDSEMSHVTAEMSFAHVPPTIAIHLHDKENQQTPRHHRRTSSTGSARIRTSPRRTHRQLETTPEVNGELADDLSKLSIVRRHPSFLGPPNNVSIIANPALLGPSTASHPTTTIRSGTNEDLNRFVSSSTASGTTLTAGSVPSYVKHPGPAQLRTIAPKDLPVMPDRMGDMMFDKVMMKWVKSVQTGGGDAPDFIAEEVSEDPFGDIESLRDDSRGRETAGDATDDEEEMELTSFSTDASGRVVAVMTGVDTDGMEDVSTTDSEGGNDAVVTGELEHMLPSRRDSESESEADEDDDATASGRHQLESESLTDAFAPPPIVITTFTTPPPSAAKVPSSALKSHTTPSSALKNHGATPTSAMKSGGATPSSALKDRYRTPRRTHRRSVSFSDGKRDGPIRGLSSVEPSARSKRIAEMLARSDSSELDSDSPTKGGARASGSGSSLVSTSASASASAAASGSSSRRAFSRSQTHRSMGANNGTFLTECSFGVAHDRLVEVLTDVEPFEPHWEGLSTVDLSGRRLESAARLKEFLPALDALNLNANQLSWLSGVPGGVRTLSVASNRLTGLTSYSHLLNLENLDISRNEVDSLRQLACLRHLRELRADGNAIASAEGLERMDGLVKLSLEGNELRALEVEGFRWTRLEMLNVSGNRIERVSGLAGLQSLVALNVDNNLLGTLDVGGAMPRLRILRASGNRLRALHVQWFAGLRTLYADGNVLEGDALQEQLDVVRTKGSVGRAAGREGRGTLSRLENLSLRNQGGRGMSLDFLVRGDVRDAKRLYLSGNALPANFLSSACYNLVYLELGNCRLMALPASLSTLAPNLRALNLNYNFLEDVRGLEGLSRLRKLSVVGARLKGTKEIIRVVRGLAEVEVLDFRMNPCTLGWYLPLLVQGEGEEPGLSAGAWAELDGRFRRGLPDAVYVGRLAYRGLVMRACPGVRVLDGVAVTEKERAKTQGVLALMQG
ncbi:hypothetical protein C8R44DRAFT_838531 [Mycena epipterygia]|nr:hypothetical protein C8R44DRAFT_838531 [Mycena epipterygia]